MSSYKHRFPQKEERKLDEHNSQLIQQLLSEFGGGGEINTMSNIGVGGVGVYAQKVGVQFQMKNINAGSSKISITDDTGNDELDIDVVMAEIKAGIEALGLALASGQVFTSADEDLTFTFGRVSLGYDGTLADGAFFGHRDHLTLASYALLQNSGGETFLNAADTKKIDFRINNSTKMLMNASALTMSVPIAMGTNKITGLGDGSAAQDAMAFGQKYTLETHKTTHQNGGGDEINVGGLSGLLAEAQTPLSHALDTHSNPTGSIGMNNQKFTGMAAGTTQGESVRYEQLHAESHALDFHSIPTGSIAMSSQKFTGLAAGSIAGDSVRFEQLGDAYYIETKEIDTTGIVDTKILKYNGTKWVIADDNTGGAGGDTDAYHDNVADEITATPAKTTPVSADEFIIEDSEASFVKKAVTFGNLKTAIVDPEGLVSDDLVFSNDTARNQTSATYVKIKEDILYENLNVRVYYEAANISGGARVGRTRLYINDVAVGTENVLTIGYTSYTEDITVNIGDKIQIWGWCTNIGVPAPCYVRYLRIKYKIIEATAGY